ncbi:hypothetical protein PPH41_36555, partial [Burkholderia gladioli]|nr:hypothetical protein [Burkholderia gladioli]
GRLLRAALATAAASASSEAEVRIHAKRSTKRSDRGIVTLAMKVVNTRKEVVQEGETLLLVQA